MRACFRGYDDWPFETTDAFAPWRGMLDRLDAEQPEAVLLWGGANVSERTFLAMASWWLRQRPARVLRVTLSADLERGSARRRHGHGPLRRGQRHE